MTITALLNEYWLDISQLFSNSQQRLYWGYLLAALFIAWAYHFFKAGDSFLASVKHAFNINSWLSRSAKADYLLIIVNKAIFLSIAPLLLTKLVVGTAVFESLHLVITPNADLVHALPSWSVIALFTFTLFIVDDFARFYLHKLMHQIPWLWQFHQTHHSAEHLTPLTVLRTHPIEGLLFSIRSALVQGVSIGVFIYFFADKVDLYTVLQVNVLVFVFNIAGANLRHSHVSIGYWRWLESIIISPAQHQIHHSSAPRHFDKNYGAILAIWDKLFGSHCYNEKSSNLQFGLSTNIDPAQHSVYNLYIKAFVEIYQSCIALFKNRSR